MSFLDGSTLATGLGFGAASMLSVGPNNLMLVREGLARGRIVTVATTVWLSYLILLLSAMAFSDLSRSVAPSLRLGLSWCGLACLAFFAFSALRASIMASASDRGSAVEPRRTCLRRVLLVVWSNPLTYLELFLIPAGYCATLVSTVQRCEFIGATLLMNAITCYGYSLGGGLCGRLIGQCRNVRVFDFLSGVLLACAAIGLALAMSVRG